MIAARHYNTEQEKGLIRQPLPCTQPRFMDSFFMWLVPACRWLCRPVPIRSGSGNEQESAPLHSGLQFQSVARRTGKVNLPGRQA